MLESSKPHDETKNNTMRNFLIAAGLTAAASAATIFGGPIVGKVCKDVYELACNKKAQIENQITGAYGPR